jgi:hypothetical protein
MDTRTEDKLAEQITDKRGFAGRWHFSPRMIDKFLAMGLPHCRIGSRRVRIVVSEGDSWMIEKFRTQRRGPSRALPGAPEREAA